MVGTIVFYYVNYLYDHLRRRPWESARQDSSVVLPTTAMAVSWQQVSQRGWLKSRSPSRHTGQLSPLPADGGCAVLDTMLGDIYNEQDPLTTENY